MFEGRVFDHKKLLLQLAFLNYFGDLLLSASIRTVKQSKVIAAKLVAVVIIIILHIHCVCVVETGMPGQKLDQRFLAEELNIAEDKSSSNV